MSEDAETPRRSGMRKPFLIIAAAATLVIAAAGTIIFAQLNAPASQPSVQAPAPSAQRDIPLSAGKSEGAGILSAKNAANVVSTVLNAKVTGDDRAETLERQLADVVRGSYLLELQAEQQELEAYGWKVTGDVKVVSLKVGKIDTRKTRAKAEVKACIDMAGTRTVDAEGRALPTAPGPTRAMNLFTFAQNPDGTWAVVRHTFPDNPAC